MRLVLDSNVLVSYLLFPNRDFGLGVRTLIERHITLFSEEPIAELVSVLARPKLARYFNPADVAEFIVWYRRFSTPVVMTERVEVCRDPKTIMFSPWH